MPKDCVYQLRLTSEEKAALASTAKERELSIAGMIRKDYGLDEKPRIVLLSPSGEVMPDGSPAAPRSKEVTPESDSKLDMLIAALEERGNSPTAARLAAEQRLKKS